MTSYSAAMMSLTIVGPDSKSWPTQSDHRSVGSQNEYKLGKKSQNE